MLYLNVDGLTNLAIAEGTTCRFTRVVGGGMEALAVELAERRGIALDDARSLIAAVDLIGGTVARASGAVPCDSAERAAGPRAFTHRSRGPAHLAARRPRRAPRRPKRSPRRRRDTERRRHLAEEER